MEKRVLFAITLSILVMLLYPLILVKMGIAPAPRTDTMPTALVEKKPVQEVTPFTKEENIKEKPYHDTVETVSSHIGNDKYILNISNIGGGIKDIIVKSYKNKDTALVTNALYENSILAIEGKGILSNLSSQPFVIENNGKSLSIENSEMRIEKNIEFLKDKYGIDAVIKITNNSNREQYVSFDITTASNMSNKELFESRYREADICYKDGKIKKVSGSKLLNANRLYKNDTVNDTVIEWLALKNKYYSIIAKPDFNVKAVFFKNVSGAPVTGFIVEDEKLLPGETKTYRINFYIGPMEFKELEKIDVGFGKVVNFGMLTSISLILLSILQFLYSIFHNYGVSILFLTILMSLFLYPLTFKSLKSMQKLQELQPHIEKIRLENKDNPTKLNKEIMELYRRYKVNPMGGCLPMFLQMPIFIALYNTLSRSIELKDAGFLWIKDLSMPDAFFRFNSSLPIFGNTINLLPILMIGAMILQQKMSQSNIKSAQTDQQRMMANIMPIVFGVIFYSLPSGLVLYWLTNTLVTSAMQFMLFRKAA